MNRLLLLIDYRGAFWSTARNVKTLCSMDVDRLRAEFERLGFAVEARPFSSIDLRKFDLKDCPVVYQSSEDRGLLYKSYIEDTLLGLQLRGAFLVPSFYCFRAHHNKVFWELLRDATPCEEIKSIESRPYGVLEELQTDSLPYPVVMKASWGAGGNSVYLAHNAAEAEIIAKKMALSDSDSWKDKVNKWRDRKQNPGYVGHSRHRRKFVTQNYISGLTHDFKVLAYGEKYYVVRRENRPNDFRASGSGRLSWPEDPPALLLEFARKTFLAFDVPLMSMDIAFDGRRFHLLEAQFVTFGTIAMENSSHHFTMQEGRWKRVNGPSLPEAEFAGCVAAYIKRKLGSQHPR